MRAFVLCGFVACLALFTGCGGDDDDNGNAAPPPAAPPATARDLSDRAFVATDVEGHDLVAGSKLTLVFPNPAQLSAQAGCNTMSGPFDIDGNVLAVGELQSTLMGCSAELQAQEDWLSGFLRSQPTASLHGDTLTLTGTDATVTLVDRKVAEPDQPIEGPRWVVDSVITSNAVSSVPPNATAFLEFDGGKVTGSTGCNRLNGPAKVGQDTITFGPIATTKMLCPDAQALENHVLAVLSGDVEYMIDAGELTLTASTGQGLMLRAEP
jgi:heat shock protein HslJ